MSRFQSMTSEDVAALFAQIEWSDRVTTTDDFSDLDVNPVNRDNPGTKLRRQLIAAEGNTVPAMCLMWESKIYPIEGNGRLIVCKEEELPYKYILGQGVDPRNPYLIAYLNKDTTAFLFRHWVSIFANAGNPQYRRLKGLLQDERFKRMPASAIVETAAANPNDRHKVKLGTYVVDSSGPSRLLLIAEVGNTAEDAKPRVLSLDSVRALRDCISHPNYNHTRMKHVIALAPEAKLLRQKEGRDGFYAFYRSLYNKRIDRAQHI